MARRGLKPRHDLCVYGRGLFLKIKPSHEGRTDIIIWVCIYGGLLSIVASFVLTDVSPALAWVLGIGGSLVTALGVILIYIRSRPQ